MRRLLIILLLILLTAKAAAVLALGPPMIEMDAAEYWRLSASVMRGDLLLFDYPIAYRTPAFPWFLASIRFLFDKHALLAIAIIQSLMSVASIWMAGRMAAKITRLPRALPLTLLFALPAVSALTFNATVLSESLFVFLLMMHLSVVQSYLDRETPGAAIGVGGTFALVLLTRPIVLLLWIPHLIGLMLIHLRKRRLAKRFLNQRDGGRARIVHVAIASLVVATVVSPWLLRNQLMFGKPFVTEFVGRNLWIVTFQDESGAGISLPRTDAGTALIKRLDRVHVIDDRDLTWTVSRGLVASGLSDAQTDQLMKRVSLDAIKTDQKQFALKAFERIINFWRTRATDLPEPSGSKEMMGQPTWHHDIPFVQNAIEHRASNVLWINNLVFGAIVIAAVMLVVHKPSRPQGIWLAMILAYFAVITGVFEIPAYRYRMVIEPLATGVVGGAVAILISKRTRSAAVVDAAI